MELIRVYAKIFTQIFDSSIADNWQHRHVFEDMLKLCDQNGFVDMTVSAVAARTRIPLGIVSEAIVALCEPDPHSRTKEEDGRRLIPIDPERSWGWKVVNYEKYRETKNEFDRKSYMAEYMRKRRSVNPLLNSVKRESNTVKLSPSASVSTSESEAGGVLRGGPLDLSNYIREKVCELYSRPNKTLSYIEQQAVAEIVKRPGVSDELILLMAFRQKGEFFPESVTSLLDNWGTTVDRARTHENHPRTDRKRFDRNKGTLNEGKTAQYNLSAINARKLRAAVPNPERPAA